MWNHLIRWAAEGDAAKRPIEVRENVKAVIKLYKQQVPSQQLRRNSSCDTLHLYVQSKFVLVRLQFFHDIAMILNIFLVVCIFMHFCYGSHFSA